MSTGQLDVGWPGAIRESRIDGTMAEIAVPPAIRSMTDMVDSKSLHGTWLHSHEEDWPGITVFRPASYAFPPSRGRSGYAFDPDGSARLIGPGADDRTASQEGRWSLSPGGYLTIDAVGNDRRHMSIKSASPEKLVFNT